MSTLIICLPAATSGATTGYDYAVTADGRTLAVHSSAPVALLPTPARGGEVIAVVPVTMLSWHQVELPKGVGPSSPRLRPILEGLLEDRLLDDAARLHLAVAPVVNASGSVWIAACDRQWLAAHLQALEAAQRPVSRVVPEFAPDTGPMRLYALDEPDAPQLVITGENAGGVIRLPLTASAPGMIEALPAEAGEQDAHVLVLAEPGVAALAEQILQTKVSLMTRPQRWLDAARSPWDLAQFDLVSSGRTRTFKRLSGIGRELLQSPAWRPARWGLVALLLGNLLGLNAWAWREQSALDATRASLSGMLTQAFPQIRVVVDAPLQMEREVATLRQASGAASERDLETMLAVTGAAMPVGRVPGSIEFAAGEARLKGLQLNAQEGSSLALQLKSLGYAARVEGDTTIIKPDASPGTAP
ncbi:type II secretion system protein GspL [Polaromonas sp.]|jgi:general secretion pathway protein L|uniref:type II secretion system protein GspL n=1 Tax=Polaromonas sp. TaxID=1869339 RepID=UPI002BFDBBE4|nr:type II secretion system protein GspL [Polaromonas sp.]HQS33033.1 type II secretion system protein GspL [Polaromonas sp.]HQS90519.1 type II secretion system protein GspL [Polaromonas sp.]